MSPRALATVAGLGVALCLARDARAELRLELRPVLGAGCLPPDTPAELVATLTNDTPAPAAGALVVDAPAPAPSAPHAPRGVRTVPAVAFRVAARSRVALRVVSAVAVPGREVIARALDGHGRTLATAALGRAAHADAALADATPGARLALALRALADPLAVGTLVPPDVVGSAPWPGGERQPTGLVACPVGRDPATGDVELPETAAGYANVSLVLIDSDALAALAPRPREALADYVLAGGSLAVAVARPDILRHPVVAGLVGAGVTATPAPPPTITVGDWLRPMGDPSQAAYPSSSTLAGAVTYRGGNLRHETLFGLFPAGAPETLGATAEYGRGRVHLLSWNPSRAPALDDPWSSQFVQRLGELTPARRASGLLGALPPDAPVPAAVRAALTPRSARRPGLGLAALALVAYALVAGPLAARALSRRPSLRWAALAPLWAAGAFAALVVAGGRHRRDLGRARAVALLEAPAGVARGAVRRYRAWDAPDAGPLVVTAAAGHALVVDPAAGDGLVFGLAERDRSSLRGFTVAAWTPAIVREEGFESLPGHVALVAAPDGGVRVANRLRARLRHVLVLASRGGARAGWYLPALRPGEAALASSGRALPPEALSRFGAATEQGLAAWDPATAARLARALESGAVADAHLLAATLGLPRDVATAFAAALDIPAPAPALQRWTVAGEPALVALVDRAADAGTDAGLRRERDDLWLHVRGWGGAP